MKATNTETISIDYDVLNRDDERVRSGKITGTFPDETSWIDMVDELLERAYTREAKKSWKASYSITETP
jgi:hypothetical protein